MAEIPTHLLPLDPNGDGSGGLAGPPAVSEVGLQDYLQVVLRRWKLIILCGILAMGAARWSQLSQVDQYMAEVVLQHAEEAAPLDILSSTVRRAIPAQTIQSQIEIIRSRAVLAVVVDSMWLRTTINGRTISPDGLFDRVEIESSTTSGSFGLARQEQGVALHDLASDIVIATATPGTWLEGPGFRLRMSVTAGFDLPAVSSAPLQLGIRHREGAVAALRNRLIIEQIPQTTLIRARYSDPDPVVAAGVVNTLAYSYQRHVSRGVRETATRRREFIANQLAQTADSLSVAQQILLEYQESTETLDPEVEGPALAATLMRTEDELRVLRFRESLLEGLVLSLQSVTGGTEGFRRLVAVSGDVLPSGAGLFARLQELEAERNRLTAARFGGPAVETVDSLIAVHQEEIRTVTEQSLDVVRLRREAAEAWVEEISASVGELPVRTAAFTRLRQRLEAVQNVFDMLMERLYEAQIVEAVEAGDVEVIDPAPPPLIPDPRNTIQTLIIALVAGLLLGTISSLLLRQMDTKVQNGAEVERATGLSILGFIPQFTSNSNGSVGEATVPVQEDLVLEAFRVLRTNLRFIRARSPDAKVFAVTSVAASEGKTTVASNLAFTFASEGKRVLIVDADMRRPTVHTVFGVGRSPGLADTLVDSAATSHAGHRSHVEGLTILPAGSVAPNPSELLGSEAFSDLLARARSSFDIVIVDTPPLLAVTDPALVGSITDGLLLIVRALATDRNALAMAASELRRMEIPVLGVIMNDIPLGRSFLGYGGYYGHYYGHYYASYAAHIEETEPKGLGAGRS